MMWARARGALRKIRGEREGERRSEKLGVSARESGAHKSYWARNTLVYTTLTTTIRRRQRVQERMEGKDNARDIRDQFLVKNDVVMAPDKFHENA